MATVEDIIKVLEENGVPMTTEEITKELYYYSVSDIEDLIDNGNIIRIKIERYQPKSELFNGQFHSVYCPSYEYYYWTHSAFNNFVIEKIKNEIVKKGSAIKYSFALIKIYEQVGDLLGVYRELNPLDRLPEIYIEYYLEGADESNWVWEDIFNEALEIIIGDSNKVIAYFRNANNELSDTLIDLPKSVKEQDARLLIKNQISEYLSMQVNKESSLQNIIYAINELELDIPYKKPYNRNLIYSVIMDYSNYFEYKDKKIKVKRDTNSVKEILLQTEDIKSLQISAISSSAIVSFVYYGNDFILKDADEYVKLRRIIYVGLVEDAKNFINTIDRQKDFELFLFLNKLLYNNVPASDWLSDNVKIGIYYDKISELNQLYHSLLSSLSPVFNLKNNPGNLFAVQLRELLESRENETAG